MMSSAYLDAHRSAAAILFDELQGFDEHQMATAIAGAQVGALIAAVCERDPRTHAPLPLGRAVVCMVFPRAMVDQEGAEEMLRAGPLLCASGHASSFALMSPGFVTDAEGAASLHDVVTHDEATGTRLLKSMPEVHARFVDVGQMALIIKCESDPQGWTAGSVITASIAMRSRRLVSDEGRFRWSQDEWSVSAPERRDARTSAIARGADLCTRHSDSELRAMVAALSPKAFTPT